MITEIIINKEICFNICAFPSLINASERKRTITLKMKALTKFQAHLKFMDNTNQVYVTV